MLTVRLSSSSRRDSNVLAHARITSYSQYDGLWKGWFLTTATISAYALSALTGTSALAYILICVPLFEIFGVRSMSLGCELSFHPVMGLLEESGADTRLDVCPLPIRIAVVLE